jgi:beta-galactosidase
VETTGQPIRLRLNPMRTTLRGDGMDVIQIDVVAVDEKDRVVPTADNKVRFQVEGCADLLGVGNGDPSSHESNRGPVRSLFHGLGCGLIKSKPASGLAKVVVTAEGLMPARIDLKVV